MDKHNTDKTEAASVLRPAAGSPSGDTKRLESALVRIAKAHGIESPLVLIAMAENDEENYAEILARYIENEMENSVKCVTQFRITRVLGFSELA